MDDALGKIKVIPDHIQISELVSNSGQNATSSSHPILQNPSRIGPNQSWTPRKLKSATSMLNLFSLRGMPWGSGGDSQEKVVLTAAEVESLRSEVAELGEREAHLKAQ